MTFAQYVRGRHVLAWLLVLMAAVTFSGCTTTDEESDLPWNTPQSWEGASGIPGLTPEM